MRIPLDVSGKPNEFISQFFGQNHMIYMNKFGIPGHNGLDFIYKQGDDYNFGKPILAAHDGTIEKAYLGGATQGNGVYIRNEKYQTVYWHLNEVFVSVGEVVKEGAVIGTMGNGGFVFPAPSPEYPKRGTHLHFALRLCDKGTILNLDNGYDGFIDPLPFLTNMMKLIRKSAEDHKVYAVLNDKVFWVLDPQTLNRGNDKLWTPDITIDDPNQYLYAGTIFISDTDDPR